MSGSQEIAIVGVDGFATEIDISAGVTSSGLALGNSTLVDILSGGVAIATSVGAETNVAVMVFAGGSAVDTTLTESYASQTVSSGGFAIGTIVQGGELNVLQGGTASASIIESGGFELGDGDISGTVVSSGGTILLPWQNGVAVTALAVEQGVTLESGAIPGVDVQAGVSATAYVVSSGTLEQVEGTTVSTIVEDGDSETVSSGGITSSTTIESGGSETVSSGGFASNTTIESGGSATVWYGGITSNMTIESGGSETVWEGIAQNNVVDGGALTVRLEGLASGTIVQNGGILTISAFEPSIEDASVNDTLVENGSVLGSGTAVGTIVGSSGYLDVTLATDTTISSGGVEVVGSGHVASGTTISFGGVDKVSGNTGSNTIDAGGIEILYSAALDLGGTVVSAGGELAVASGIAVGTMIYGVAIVSGSSPSYDSYTGLTSNAFIGSGGSEIIIGDGTAEFTSVGNGGSLYLEGSGIAEGTVVGSGGSMIVAGGRDESTVISSGGEMIVSAGGGVVETTILNGGLLELEEGATVVNAVVSSGGKIVISSGGVVEGTGEETIQIVGGLVVLSAGVATAGSAAPLVVFSGSGGTLEIDGTEIPSLGEIADFAPGDTIDLAEIPFATGAEATLKSGNLLQITEGSNTYTLYLYPYENFRDERFTLTSDGSSGTDITPLALPPTWTGPSAAHRSGDWNSVDDWNTDAVPGATAQATISAAGTYTITNYDYNTIGNLVLGDASATLDIAEYRFTIAGLGTDINAGTIAIDDAATLQVTGIFTNNGTIALKGTSHATSLIIAGSVTLKGTGQVTLSDSASNAIVSNGAAATLTNLSTIAGSGKIGDAHLTLTNGSTGIIDATGTAAALTIASARTFVNQGSLEASGSAGLIVDATLSNTGLVTVANGSRLQVTGTVTNNGLIALKGKGDATSLIIAGSVTLAARGQVTLSDSAGNAIVSDGAAATLTNQSTIAGSGTIGDADLTLINATTGVIDATGTAAALTIASAGTFKNQGKVESTGSAGLTIEGPILNTGTLTASAGDLAVTGIVTGTGKETVADNATLTFDAHVAATQTVTFTGSTGTLGLALAQGFTGTVAGLATGDAIDLENFTYSATKLSMTFGGSDARGSDTLVTIKDGNLTATIALFNQTAGEFGMSASDYTLSSDHRSGTAGTLFQLAASVG